MSLVLLLTLVIVYVSGPRIVVRMSVKDIVAERIGNLFR